MIFAMASIGAIYYDDELTAASLHRMSKANTIKYVRKANPLMKHVP